MAKLDILECIVVTAESNANRYLREATAHIDSQELWDLWRQAKTIAEEARRHWQKTSTKTLTEIACSQKEKGS